MIRERRTTFFSGILLDPQDFRVDPGVVRGPTRAVDLEIRSNGTAERWAEVPDFASSGPADRHFVLDRPSGRVRFGDGEHGRVPETGSHVAASYRSGAGGRGLLVAIPLAAGLAGFLAAMARHRRA